MSPMRPQTLRWAWQTRTEVGKRYLKAHLLDDDWPSRVALIERVTRDLPYPTRFTDEGEFLVRRMARVPRPVQPLHPHHPEQRRQLEDLVLRMHQLGLVHGDLNAKNLLWDGQQVVILDFEPSLLQLQGYRPCLMGTAPFMHPADVRARRLSQLTDQLCLLHLQSGLRAALCARLVDGLDHAKP